MKLTIQYFLLLMMMGACLDEPVREDAPELITKVTLTFTPVGGGDAIVVSASDPDGDGIQSIAADGAIMLQQNQTYTLNISLFNELADPTSPQYNITAEVEEEGDEHLFFFAWTNNLFSAPSGDGNIDDRTHELDYQDSDGENPIGLITQWQTVSSIGTGKFTILLKHQPSSKSATSSSEDGETDLNLMFDLEIQ
jgi:hypothetical protein